MPSKPLVIYRGPSQINGAPIVAILTGDKRASANAKTGPMAQLWILPADVSPVDAVKTGDDASVCGGCPHRPANKGTCYVSVWQAPRSIWQAWLKAGAPGECLAYACERLAESLDKGRTQGLRLGAYGDPAAVPEYALAALVGVARARGATVTGYTHQWRMLEAKDAAGHGSAAFYRANLMASADTSKDTKQAKTAGWRVFRVHSVGEWGAHLPGVEVECASDLYGMSCAECGACDGATNATDGAQVVWITAHGARAKQH